MKEHPIHKGYYLSEDGELYSAWKKVSDGYKSITSQIVEGHRQKRHPSINNGGYLCLTIAGRKNYKVHRLVAETYIPNPDNLPQVNHKNGDRTDNRVENLEWVTSQQNNEHAMAKSYEMLEVKTGKVLTIFNLQQFSREIGANPSNFYRFNKNGTPQTVKGYKMIKGHPHTP